MAPEFPYPVPLDDCVMATKYFIQNAAKFNVDPNRVAIGGKGRSKLLKHDWLGITVCQIKRQKQSKIQMSDMVAMDIIITVPILGLENTLSANGES